jgi:formylglycine-generating enzyme required for sulfatase activity
MTRAWRRRAGWIALALWVSCGAAQALVVKDYEPTGPQPSVVDEKGERRALYKQSHALLISVSDYLGPGRKGWKPLKETGREMDRVAEALRPHGFRVRRVSDPKGMELQEVIQKFLAERGRDKEHRLLVFFSGHGYTDPVTGVSYLVPVDAADPVLMPEGLLSTAMPIAALPMWSQSIQAKHALFLFDSCFSGSVFQTKSDLTRPDARGETLSERYRFLLQNKDKAVRQFIAAGGPDETVPAQSQFVPLFIEALGGRASQVRDGYVTGKELGLWLEHTLPSLNPKQSPHSDVIQDSRMVFGDIVFQVPGAVVPVPVRPPEPPVVQAETRSAPPADPFPPGKRFRDCEDTACPWMVVVPAGSFMMGSPANEPGRDSDEGPQHRVSISKFAMGQYEVTQGQWKALMSSNPSDYKDCGDECPVENVSWDDAQEFVKKLNAKTGKAYRLPSEAEWEYAARAGTTTAYSFGVMLSATQANCGEGAPRKPVAVGRYPANPFGLSDMHGSVWEWTEDRFAPYQAGEAKAPVVHQDKKESHQRVLRGGSWVSSGRGCRSAGRNRYEPDGSNSTFGFRLARGLAD